MGDQEVEVRKSIVRISFDWMPEEKGKEVMVIAGIILSINDDGSAIIAADSTFFEKLHTKQFQVNFPSATGRYEEAQKLDVIPNPDPKESDVLGPYEYAEGFYIFTAMPREEGYIKAVKFETQPVKGGDPVYPFVFLRKAHSTPTIYCRASVTGVSRPVLSYECAIHEYGYLGTPLFNESGDLVGITYLDLGQLQAWTVWQLQWTFRHYSASIVFVSNGKEAAAAAAGAEAAAGGEAQVEAEEPAGAKAQVEE